MRLIKPSEIKYDFTLTHDSLPSCGASIPRGRLRLEKIAYRVAGDGSAWVECTYRRNWLARIYLTVRGWFVSP